MQRCIELAKNGIGTTYPNPLVGSVIVYKNRIIGEGWHHSRTNPHAEVKAIRYVKDKSLLKHSTLYVNLEPCSYYGSTPPCSDLIVKHGIPTVVFGIYDENSNHICNGARFLKENNVKIIDHVLANSSKELNKRYNCFHLNKRPYIILKWAESKDGFIDRERRDKEVGIRWISNEYSQQLVHQWRSEEHSILVGTNTIINDNPQLSVRRVKGRQPIRIFIDRNLSIPLSYSMYNDEIETFIFSCRDKNLNLKKTRIISIDFNAKILPQILTTLYELSIHSVLVEGGKNTIENFINENLWDEARVFRSKSYLIKKGLRAPNLPSTSNFDKLLEIDNDELSIYQNAILRTL